MHIQINESKLFISIVYKRDDKGDFKADQVFIGDDHRFGHSEGCYSQLGCDDEFEEISFVIDCNKKREEYFDKIEDGYFEKLNPIEDN